MALAVFATIDREFSLVPGLPPTVPTRLSACTYFWYSGRPVCELASIERLLIASACAELLFVLRARHNPERFLPDRVEQVVVRNSASAPVPVRSPLTRSRAEFLECLASALELLRGSDAFSAGFLGRTGVRKRLSGTRDCDPKPAAEARILRRHSCEYSILCDLLTTKCFISCRR